MNLANFISECLDKSKNSLLLNAHVYFERIRHAFEIKHAPLCQLKKKKTTIFYLKNIIINPVHSAG